MDLTVSTGRGASATWGWDESETVQRCWQSLPRTRHLESTGVSFWKAWRVHGQVKEIVLHCSRVKIRTALTPCCDPIRACIFLFLLELSKTAIWSGRGAASSQTELASLLCCRSKTAVWNGTQQLPMKVRVSVHMHVCVKVWNEVKMKQADASLMNTENENRLPHMPLAGDSS